jgi:hypothetical protein
MTQLAAIQKYYPHYTDGVIYPTTKQVLLLLKHQPVVPHMWDDIHHKLHTYFGLTNYNIYTTNKPSRFDLRKKEKYLVEIRARKLKEKYPYYSTSSLRWSAEKQIRSEKRHGLIPK